MSDIRFFMHLFDDSYNNAESKNIEENLSDFADLVQKLHKNKSISFSYDEDFYNVPTNGNISMANCIYSSDFDKQAKLNFEQCLSHFQPFEKKVVDINSFKHLRPSGDDYSFWGLLFNNKEKWCISNSNEAHDYINFQFDYFLSPENFWDLREFVFPKLRFIKEIKESIRTVTGGDFFAVKKDLVALNSYVANHGAKNFNDKNFESCTSVKISGESETVKKNPKLRDLRCFDIPNVRKVFCEKHMKTENHRTYIYPDRENDIMWIVYIGPHLSTAKY